MQVRRCHPGLDDVLPIGVTVSLRTERDELWGDWRVGNTTFGDEVLRELNTVRVVHMSGDEHVFHGFSKEGNSYTIRENGVLEIGLTPGFPWRTLSSSAWAYVEGDVGRLTFDLVEDEPPARS